MEERDELPFYLLGEVAFVILFGQLWSVYVCGVFPCVVAFGVPFPLDEVLEAF